MPEEFKPFNRYGGVNRTRRRLPHWQQNGGTYFVTFRLADSLPIEAIRRLEEIRELNPAEGFEWVDRYLDAGTGRCILSHSRNLSLMESVLRHFDDVRYALGSFVVMPNHVHALVQPLTEVPLTQIVRSWKSFSATHLEREAGSSTRIWQKESFDRIVRDESELRRFHRYILDNPTAVRLPAGTFTVGCGKASWLPSQQ